MKTLFTLLVAAIIISCTSTKQISGPVERVNGDTLTVNGSQFKVSGPVPALGTNVVFQTTPNRRKVNSKKL